METDFILIVMAFLGILGHFTAKFWNSMTTSETFPVKKHLLFAGYSAVIMAAWILAGEHTGFLPELSRWSAFLVGYFADSVIKNFSLFNPFEKKP